MAKHNIWSEFSLSRSGLQVPTFPELNLLLKPVPILKVDDFRWVAPDDTEQSKKPGLNRALWNIVPVLIIHLALLTWIFYEREIPVVKLAQPPIMVSLISLPAEKPAPAPETVPLVKQKPVEKPVIKPKETSVKQVTQRPAPVVERIVEPAPEQPKFEATTVATPPPPEAPAVAVPMPATAAPTPVSPPKAEKEEKEEPPKFGVAYLNNPAPEYPRMSKRAGEEGRVFLKVLVSAEGRPDSVEVSKSSGFERLDNAALNAVKQWRFEPARKGGKAISAFVIVPLSFTLN